MLFGLSGGKKSKKERRAAAEQASREFAEKEARFQEEYDRVCAEVEKGLLSAKKPVECNVVTSHVFGADSFPGLKDYQWSFKDWEIWRTGDHLYLYSPTVNGHPDYEKFGLFIGEPAPMLLSISVPDIQYFKMEGDVFHETKISGGKVTQNQRTGKVKQTPLQAKTVNRDTRYVRVTAQKNGIIKYIDFGQEAYDVLFLLIPEKEFSRL